MQIRSRAVRSLLPAPAILVALLASAADGSAGSGGFYANAGQADPSILFHGQAGDAGVFFETDGVTILTGDRRRIRIGFEETTSGALPRGRDRLPGVGNFVRGADPARWRCAVPSWREVAYEGLWPGVDLGFALGADGVLVARAWTASAADTAAIRIRVSGDPDLARRFRLACATASHSGGAPGARDAPPSVVWSTYLGGTEAEYGNALAVRPSGEVLVAGVTFSLDYPLDSLQSGGGDVCVSQFDATGSSVLWSTVIGGGALDLAQDVALAPDGDVILTGKTESADYPVTARCADETFNGTSDVFVTRLDANGLPRWSTYLGGGPYEIAFGLETDPSGNVAVAGYTQSPDFPTTPGALDRTHNGAFDIFLTLVSGGGDRWLWSTFLGGANEDRAYALARVANGDYVLTAWTQSLDFPVTPGAYDVTPNGSADVYVARVNASGTRLQWSTLLGGTGLERAYALAVDGAGDVLVAGLTHSADFPVTPAAADTSYGGGGDAFVARLSGTGDTLRWCTYFGGSGEDAGHGLALDAAGRTVLAGSTQSPDLPTAGPGIDDAYGGVGDAFAAMLDASASAIVWGTYIGGSALDTGNALALADGGDILVAGETESVDFPHTPGCADSSWNGGLDAWAARLRAVAATSVPVQDHDPARLSVVPNPVRGWTDVVFSLGRPALVRCGIYRADGALVRDLAGGFLRAGDHRIRWHGDDARGRALPAGSYRVRLEAEGRVTARPLALIW